MVSNNSLVELSPKEMHIWGGPVHYISLQAVENEDSDTTPMRVVSNSSLSDRKGLSLNSILMKVLTPYQTNGLSLTNGEVMKLVCVRTSQRRTTLYVQGRLRNIFVVFSGDLATLIAIGKCLPFPLSALAINQRQLC